jgi:hypothetical protein
VTELSAFSMEYSVSGLRYQYAMAACCALLVSLAYHRRCSLVPMWLMHVLHNMVIQSVAYSLPMPSNSHALRSTSKVISNMHSLNTTNHNTTISRRQQAMFFFIKNKRFVLIMMNICHKVIGKIEAKFLFEYLFRN